MSGFTAEWLALREPADAAARSASLTRAIAAALGTSRLRALDLATGTGSNVRYLSPRLPSEQQWLLVDVDDAVLARVALPRGLPHETRRVDLSALEDGLFEDRALVTASALLDLVSEAWLEALARVCRRARPVLLFALTYDGRVACSPEEPEDDEVRRLVNGHQRTDKGFGPALGPDAVPCADQVLSRAGYEIRREPSDWVLAPGQRALQHELIEGWAAAAMAMAPKDALRIAGWRDRRLAHVAADRSCLVVGHEDLAAIPI